MICVSPLTNSKWLAFRSGIILVVEGAVPPLPLPEFKTLDFIWIISPFNSNWDDSKALIFSFVGMVSINTESFILIIHN